MQRLSVSQQVQARKLRSEARTRRSEAPTAEGRALVVDSFAIQRREELAAELLSYYEFLTTLYLPKDCIKRPPKEGWPSITAEHLAFLGKTDTVIDLLKHIPYISQDIEEGYQLYEKCICIDYTGTPFERQAVKHHSKSAVDPMPEFLDSFIWDRLNAMQHIATIARSASRDGHYIMIDTRDGQLATIEFMDGRSSIDGNSKNLCDSLKECFRSLAIFPTRSTDVQMADNQPYTGAQIDNVKKIFRKHGWPNTGFRKDMCMAEVSRLWESY